MVHRTQEERTAVEMGQSWRKGEPRGRKRLHGRIVRKQEGGYKWLDFRDHGPMEVTVLGKGCGDRDLVQPYMKALIKQG